MEWAFIKVLIQSLPWQ